MVMIGKSDPVRCFALHLKSENRASNPPMSPAARLYCDIFSPLPGDSDVNTHFERLSSNETKIAPNCVRIAVGPAEG